MNTFKHLVLLLALLAGMPANCQNPQLETHNLKNGIRVYFIKYGKIEAMHVKIMTGSGKKNEAPGQEGFNNMVATLLLKGNKRFSMETQNNRLFAMGTEIDVEAGYDYTSLEADVLSQDAEQLLDVLSAALREPLFEKEKVEQHLSLLSNYNQPSKMDITPLAAVYSELVVHGRENPLGRYIHKKQLKAITPEKIRDFHRFNFVPANTHLIVCGNFNSKNVLAAIDKHFGDWQAAYTTPNKVALDQPKIKKTESYFVNRSGATQTALQWTFKGPSASHKDFLAFTIANQIFNQVLFKEIREKGGKTYNISSYLRNSQFSDLVYVRTSVRSAEVESTLSLFNETLLKFSQGGFSEEEFRNEVARFKFHLNAAEQPDELASFFNPVLYDFKQRTKAVNEVQKLKLEDIRKVAAKYFNPDHYKLVIAGDETVLTSQLARIPKLKKLEPKDLEYN